MTLFYSSDSLSDKINKESVRAIERGIFTLCLDSPVMRISDDKYGVSLTFSGFCRMHRLKCMCVYYEEQWSDVSRVIVAHCSG